VEEVTILNQNTASRFFSRDYWGVVMATGHLGNSDATALNRDIANGSPISHCTIAQKCFCKIGLDIDQVETGGKTSDFDWFGDTVYKNTSAQSYSESGRSHDIEPEHGFTFFQP